MRTFWAVFKNDYFRMIPRIASVITVTVVTLASIFLAVYVTKIQQVKGHIAFITSGTAAELPKNSSQLSIAVLSKKPPRSDLVKQKYDAYITVDGKGSYQIDTLRSDDFKSRMLLLLKNPNADITDPQTDRGAGVNIIGFMMMFLLMIAFSNLFAFADDKEQGQLRRVAAAPASFGWYLAAHCVYSLSMLIPEYLFLVVLKLCGWNIGFTLWQYAGLMAVLGFLGISFAMFLNTLIHKPDNANMLGNAVTVLASIFAGSFYSFSKSVGIVDHLVKLLPQKELMNFAQNMQNGIAYEHMGSIFYVMVFSLTLFIFSCVVLHRMYVKKV